jgi:hypothetical protein
VAIELPGPVVSFLNVGGVSWPYANEDKVRDFASHIREFASAVDTTHQQATDTVKQLGAHYEGPSYEALLTARGAGRLQSRLIMDRCRSVEADEVEGAFVGAEGCCAESCGDVGVAGGAESVDGEAAESGHVLRAVSGADLGGGTPGRSLGERPRGRRCPGRSGACFRSPSVPS